MSATTLLETVAVFDTAANFQDAIDELMSSDFDRADLSFAAAWLEAPSTSAPLPQLASSSVTAVPLAAEIDGALLAGTAGGLIGFLFARHIANLRRRHQREQLDHGGLLLWVRTPDVRHIKRAVEILFNHSGRDVHVHAFPTGA
jgi:hypothetical protein